MAIAKGDNADNQFNGVSKRRIQESAQSFSQSHGDFFRRKREDRGEGDDGEEVEDEDSVGIPFQFAGGDGDRYDEKQNIYIACHIRAGARQVSHELGLSIISHRGLRLYAPGRGAFGRRGGRELTAQNGDLGNVPGGGGVPHEGIGAFGTGGGPPAEEELLPGAGAGGGAIRPVVVVTVEETSPLARIIVARSARHGFAQCAAQGATEVYVGCEVGENRKASVSVIIVRKMVRDSGMSRKGARQGVGGIACCGGGSLG